MALDEKVITQAIVDRYFKKLKENLSVDVAVVGGGPSGLVCSYFLARKGFKVTLFERKLSIGGGMWGGGMMFPRLAFFPEAAPLLDFFKIRYSRKENLLIAGAVETVGKLIARAADSGLKFFNGIVVEDVIIRPKRVEGVVVNWTAVNQGGFHIDPVALKSKIVVDSTGHACEIARLVERKVGRLKTPTGKIMGEGSMWVKPAEKEVVANAREIYPGLFVTGMAGNAVFGSPRMGPIFGGMFLSGERVARLIAKKLKKKGK